MVWEQLQPKVKSAVLSKTFEGKKKKKKKKKKNGQQKNILLSAF